MDFDEYQRLASETDQAPRGNENDKIIPLLGLVGEVGTLLVEYKKFLRDGPAHELLSNNVAEELGDCLWYLTNLATKFGIPLQVIAETNLVKTRSRWKHEGRIPLPMLLDDRFPSSEQIPREFEFSLTEEILDGVQKVVLRVDGEIVGNALRDNVWTPDGYRFHDVFHIAHAVYLGWSPTFRRLLGRKRKSDADVDEIEDGGRAGVIDEAIVALEWDYARKALFLEGVSTVDYAFLSTIKSISSHLEVGIRSIADWQSAILGGFAVWREVNRQRGGHVRANLVTRSMEYTRPPDTHL